MNWWVALVLVLPMLVVDNIMNVTELPRFVLLAAFCLVYLLVVFVRAKKRLEFKAKPLTVLLGSLALAFLGLMILSSSVAVNKQASLDFILRYALMLLATVLFFFTVSAEIELLPRLFKALVIVALLQAAIGILQFYEIAFTQVPPTGHLIPYGLHGNRNLFSSFIAFLFPFCGYLAYAGDRKWRLFSGAVLWLCIYALILGQSRSSWVAVAGTLCICTAIVLTQHRRLGAAFVKGWFKAMAFIVLGTVAAATLAFTIPNNQGLGRQLKDRAASLVKLSDEDSLGSGAARIGLWKQSLKMIREHPLLGVGAGNWRVVGGSYGTEGLDPAIAQGLLLRDRAHNVYLHNGAEVGVLGMLVYVAIWVVLAIMGVRVFLASTEDRRRILALSAFAVMLTFSIDSLFSFANERTAHCLLVGFAAAIIAALSERTPVEQPAGARICTWLPNRVCLLVPLLLLAFMLFYGGAKVRFEFHNLRARYFLEENRPEQVLEEVKAGLTPLVTISPHGEPLEFWAADAFTTLGQYDRALGALDRTQTLNPWYPLTGFKRGRVYAKLGRPANAIASYRETLKLAPEFQRALTAISLAYYSQGRYKECVETLQSSRYTEEAEFVHLLALAHKQLGQNANAMAVLREGLVRFPESVKLLDLLAAIEYAEKDLPNALVHYQKLIQLEPNNPKNSQYQKAIESIRGLPGQ